nr:hypothetical protein [Phyllobacterium phragmitis]
MDLEGREALRARQDAGSLSLKPSYEAARIAVTPEEVLVDRQNDGRLGRLVTIGKPQPVIAIVVGDEGVETIPGKPAIGGQCLRIRER